MGNTCTRAWCLRCIFFFLFVFTGHHPLDSCACVGEGALRLEHGSHLCLHKGLLLARLLFRRSAYTDGRLNPCAPTRTRGQTRARTSQQSNNKRRREKRIIQGTSFSNPIVSSPSSAWTQSDDAHTRRETRKRETTDKKQMETETKIFPVWSASACALADGYTACRHTPSNATLPLSFHLD